MPSNLINTLLTIELHIKNKEWDRAYELYQRLNRDWENLSRQITQEEAERALKLLNFLEELLGEHLKSLTDESKHLDVLKAYSKFY